MVARILYCHYCAKRAVRFGSCKRAAGLDLPVCGRHFHCITQPNENIGHTV